MADQAGQGRRRTARLTSAMTHARARADTSTVLLLFVLASTPAMLVSAWSAGQQMLLRNPASSGWRWQLLHASGLSISADEWMSCLLLGLAHILPVLRYRSRSIDPGWTMVAWIYVLLLPVDLSPSLAAVGMTFAAVLGQHILLHRQPGSAWRFVRAILLSRRWPAIQCRELGGRRGNWRRRRSQRPVFGDDRCSVEFRSCSNGSGLCGWRSITCTSRRYIAAHSVGRCARYRTVGNAGRCGRRLANCEARVALAPGTRQPADLPGIRHHGSHDITVEQGRQVDTRSAVRAVCNGDPNSGSDTSRWIDVRCAAGDTVRAPG